MNASTSSLPTARAALLHVLMLPDFVRADRIGEFYGNRRKRTFAELLIDAEEDPYLRAVLVGMLRRVAKVPPGSSGAPRAGAARRARVLSQPRRRIRSER